MTGDECQPPLLLGAAIPGPDPVHNCREAWEEHQCGYDCPRMERAFNIERQKFLLRVKVEQHEKAEDARGN